MSTEQQEYQPELLAEEWGARLTTARENLSLSVEQVATDLNLPADYILKLEQCSLEGLPSMVFARGYIRAYAKLLHLDDNELVHEFEQIHGEGGSGQIKPVSSLRKQVKMNDPVMKFSSWLFVLAIIGLSVWWWQTQYGVSGNADITQANEAEADTVAIESSGSAPVVTLEDGSAQLVLPKLDDAPADEASIAPQPVEEAPKVEDQSAPSDLTAEEIKKLQAAIDQGNDTEQTVSVEANTASALPAAELTGSTVSVSADFIAECWVSIKDADGKTLFNNLRGKGQSLNVEGKAPLSILIGAADAVGNFSFNGNKLDLSEHSRKNVVRISLPLAE